MDSKASHTVPPHPDFKALAAPGVRGLQPYAPGKPLIELEREYGIVGAVKLASNENPLGPSPLALSVLQDQLNELARYPDGNGFALKQALAMRLQISDARITLGNGSNDILELIARAFVTPENEVVFSKHSFAVYPIVTQAVGAAAVVTPAKNWGHDLQAMHAAITPRTRLVFIANPNNPTGTWVPGAELYAFLQAVPSHVLVVVDEAYFEYASHPAMQATDYPNAMTWLDEFPGLIVTRTFSKAYGLAGLRIGYGVSHPQVAELLNRVRQPFNINSLALAAAEAALEDQTHIDNSVELNTRGMQQLISRFEEPDLNYIPSVGNFICVRVGNNAMEVYEGLLRAGVIVRPVESYGMPGFLRVTVGQEAENQRFLDALAAVLGSTPDSE